LRSAAAEIDDVLITLNAEPLGDRSGWETENLALAARSIVAAALLREESRGAHFRSDFPATDSALDERHFAFGGNGDQIWSLTSLDDARAHRSSRKPAGAT
jgi:L-aspartate oxidase